MLLAIDVGNTNTSFAVYDGDEEKAFFVITTKMPRTSDEFASVIRGQLHTEGLKKGDITGCIISSVVPGVMHSLTSGVRKLADVEPMIVGAGVKTGVRISLANPREVGADRIVDLAEAYELYGGPTLVIDFGTATTYDLIEADGTFRYGITSPGIRICANALWNDTAKLPEIELKLPKSVLANDTVSSMQVGLLYAAVGQTEFFITRVKKEAGLKEMKVVATGGLGRIVSEATDMIDVYDMKLTMKGLKMLYERNIR